ncbi:E2 ubiquitin-conjugating enzyme [Malassezia psittaci]|uniref:E2 ubiquitin-conjugating enzyme n=1 Tax=Malassezia psittaci TaxID=1821823 RepID=A0AAF0F343_9BASI|nr:E2 ubiquitin-conjugating enzyme [Malassezia psittaci]
MSELSELEKDPSPEYRAVPTEDNLFEWHFTLRGPRNTEFDSGMYHGKIILPTEYPFKPPDVMFLTPNGRWEVNRKICLTFTGYHEETWQPAWGIRTALLSVQSLMSSQAEEGGIGAVSMTREDREKLAVKSGFWSCSICGCTNQNFMASQPTQNTDQDEIFRDSSHQAATHPNEQTITDDAQETITSFDPTNLNDSKDEDQADISTQPSIDEIRENHTPHGTLDEPNYTKTHETTDASISDSEPDRQTSESMQEPSSESVSVATPSNNHTQFSIAATFRARVRIYTQLVMVMDAICGAISALLVLWVLKHL